jgi:RimJ/RimL family protein N-acetyltransferase
MSIEGDRDLSKIRELVGRVEEPVKLTPFAGAEGDVIKDWFEHDDLIRLYYYTNRGIVDYSEWVRKISESTNQAYFRIEHGGCMVGFVKISEIDPVDVSYKIGVVIPDTQRRKGYALQALHAVIGQMNELGYIHARANILEDNIGSINLFEKIGFQRIGQDGDYFLYERLN